MELLAHHGLDQATTGLNKKQLAAMLQEADRLEDEPWLIQVGPQLWRAFLKIVPRGHSLAEVVAKLAAKEPKLIHKLLSDTLESIKSGEDPAGPRETLTELMAQLEEETPAEFDKSDYEQIEDEFAGDEYEDEDDESWDTGEPW
jgi:putative NIF3 family GTP cyclohydrolase 1 type 2